MEGARGESSFSHFCLSDSHAADQSCANATVGQIGHAIYITIKSITATHVPRLVESSGATVITISLLGAPVATVLSLRSKIGRNSEIVIIGRRFRLRRRRDKDHRSRDKDQT